MKEGRKTESKLETIACSEHELSSMETRVGMLEQSAEKRYSNMPNDL
jgi:hypothetical protein